MLLGIKKGKNSESPVFEDDSLESQASHSCRSFVKSDESNLLTVPLFKDQSVSLTSLFCKERQERFAHSCSFLKSDESVFLTVALF